MKKENNDFKFPAVQVLTGLAVLENIMNPSLVKEKRKKNLFALKKFFSSKKEQ